MERRGGDGSKCGIFADTSCLGWSFVERPVFRPIPRFLAEHVITFQCLPARTLSSFLVLLASGANSVFLQIGSLTPIHSVLANPSSNDFVLQVLHCIFFLQEVAGSMPATFARDAYKRQSYRRGAEVPIISRDGPSQEDEENCWSLRTYTYPVPIRQQDTARDVRA